MRAVFATAADVPPGFTSAEARTMRSAAGVRVVQGDLSIVDVITEAWRGGPTHPYRGISLIELLTAQPRVGRAGADRFLARVGAFLGQEAPPTDATLRWLLDGRSARRRLRAWQEASRKKSVNDGFPWNIPKD